MGGTFYYVPEIDDFAWWNTIAREWNMKGRREGEVKKRGDNKWFIRIFLGLDAEGKKRYSSKVVEGTRTEAEKQLRAFLSERDAGAIVAPSAVTLDQHLDRWLELMKIQVAERTAEDYKKFLAIYVRPELGSKKLSSLKTADIQAIYTGMLNRKLASRTVHYVHTILKAALKCAEARGISRAAVEGPEPGERNGDRSADVMLASEGSEG